MTGPQHGVAPDVLDLVGLGDFGDQVLDVAGLHEVVERALAHGRDAGLDVGVPREHDDLGLGGDFLDLLQRLDAVHARHLDIEQYDIEPLAFFDGGHPGCAVEGGCHLEAAAAQELGQVLNEALLVVDQQHADGVAHGASSFDGFVKNPISALRFIPLSLRRTARTPHSTGLFASQT